MFCVPPHTPLRYGNRSGSLSFPDDSALERCKFMINKDNVFLSFRFVPLER